MKVLGISSSPRDNGNSDLLLRQALAGASSAGAEAEYLRLNKLNISPCTACGACYATGMCITEDDFQIVLPKMLQARRLIFASPIYFMSVCAQAKILIDRCQCLWARKYLLKRALCLPEGEQRLGMAIAVGATKNTKMFDSIRLTMKYYFDALDMGYFANLFVSSVDEAGKIADNQKAMEDAFRLGTELADAEGHDPKETIEVELIG
ncbi:MAG: flavodoxin family protein [Sedimentisphaerales bacterium]|nr:flavodoxin family protein [Sedimentisphaerales bacterium]